VLVHALALVLAAEPEPPPTPDEELPHWRSVLPREKPKPPPKLQVPNTGVGLISLGSLLLGGGATLGATAIGFASWDDSDPSVAAEGRRAVLGMVGGFSIGAGTTMLAIGLVIRRQFRASPAAAIPNAPRTGAGMQLAGLGLIAMGSGFATFGMLGFAGSCQNCETSYTQAVALSLSLGLASATVGSGLMIGGAVRRGKYKAWAEGRAAHTIAPTLSVGPNGVHFGVAGRF
jgi:hypothetical protein